MTIIVEILVALALSSILIQGYRVLRRPDVAGRETVAADLFAGIGAVAVMVSWIVVLSTVLMA